MSEPDDLPPTWCQKLNETTEIILEQWDTSWKIWTTVTKDKSGSFRFNFIVKQHTGSPKSAIFTIHTGCDEMRSWIGKLYFSNFTRSPEYQIIRSLKNDYQFVISADVLVNGAHRVKPVRESTDKDKNYLMTIGYKKFTINKSISETLEREFAGGEHQHEVELVGVDFNDFITLINNPESIDNDLTVERARRFHLMQKKYGIRHYSEKIEKMMEVDFWENSDGIEYRKVHEKLQTQETTSDMMILKKYRITSLPNKFTINALDMKLDVYFYIQEYNVTSYLSIGVIGDMRDIRNQPIENDNSDNDDDDDDVNIIDDKDKYWSKSIGLNIQLHYPNNPQLTKSADITRDFNSYQRSAGCPTFMLRSELRDYCQRDGSYVVTITLSPTDNPTGPLYPGIKDTTLCSGGMRINVSRDLLLHYCESFQTFLDSDNLSADNIPIVSLLILLDLIYHRSSSQIINNIQNVLKMCQTVQCQFIHDHVDQLLANRYRNQQIQDTKEFHDSWDLPLLREAERMPKHRSSRSAGCGEPVACSSKVPSEARFVRPLTVNRLLDIILTLKVFNNKNERSRLCAQFQSENGLLKLRQYRMALCTLEGVPQELRMDLKDAWKEIREGQAENQQAHSVGLRYAYHRIREDQERNQGFPATVRRGLEAFEKLLNDGGFKGLEEEANKERKIIQDARSELGMGSSVLLSNRGRNKRRTISMVETIVARNEEDCLERRRMAANIFVEKLRKEEGSGKEEEDGTLLDEIRIWAQYLGSLTTLQF